MGEVQVICWKSLRDAQCKELLRARLLVAYGKWQREGDVKNLITATHAHRNCPMCRR